MLEFNNPEVINIDAYGSDFRRLWSQLEELCEAVRKMQPPPEWSPVGGWVSTTTNKSGYLDILSVGQIIFDKEGNFCGVFARLQWFGCVIDSVLLGSLSDDHLTWGFPGEGITI